jgi:hypothetical protein
MEFKGQVVHVVYSFDTNDVLTDLRIFADKHEARDYEIKANKREKRYGGHAYTEPVTVN